MRFKIKIIEISDDLKSKSNHDFDFKIKIVPISDIIYMLDCTNQIYLYYFIVNVIFQLIFRALKVFNIIYVFEACAG